MWLNTAVEKRSLKIAEYFTEQCLVNLDLKNFRKGKIGLNKSYDRVKTWRVYERLFLYFYPVGSFSLLANKSDPRLQPGVAFSVTLKKKEACVT